MKDKQRKSLVLREEQKLKMGLLTLKSKRSNIKKFVSSPSECLVEVETDVARELLLRMRWLMIMMEVSKMRTNNTILRILMSTP